MSKKTSIGTIVLTVGVILSLSFYATYGLAKTFDISSNYTIAIHDNYIQISVWFIWWGIFSLLLSAYTLIAVIKHKLKSVRWNITHIFSLISFSSLLYYGKAIFDFGFSLYGRLLDSPSKSGWTVYPPLSSIPKDLMTHQESLGFWESILKHSVTVIIATCILMSIFLVFGMLKMRRIKPV